MGFFDDIFGAVTGQQKSAPYNELSVQDAISQAAPMAANANLAYNQIYQPGITKLGLDVSNTVNPYANELEKTTTKSILDQLNLGSALPKDVQDLVIQQALEASGATGFGTSNAGRALTARDLGLSSLDLLNQRINTAAGFSPVATSMAGRFFRPTEQLGVGEVGGALQGQNESRNQRAAEDFYRSEGNKIAAFNTFGRIGGGILGGVFGGPAGATLGSSIGGGLIQNPYRVESGGGSDLFSGLFSSEDDIGGQEYGIGKRSGMAFGSVLGGLF